MARPRRFLLLSLAAVGVGVAVVVWALWPPRTLTQEDAAGIREGMTLAEVETILSRPADARATGITIIHQNKGISCSDVKLWHCSDDDCIFVAFDQNGTVMCAGPAHYRIKTFLGKVRILLGL